MSKSRYQTPARLGWGQTALMLHPGLASLGKLGPLGGRLSDKEAREEEEEDKMKSKKKKRKKISKEEQQRREEEEEEAKYFSNMDLFLYLGLFLFSAGLVVMILLLPLPNTWLLTESLVQVQYSTVQYSTVQYSTVQYSTVQYSTSPGLGTRVRRRLPTSCPGSSGSSAASCRSRPPGQGIASILHILLTMPSCLLRSIASFSSSHHAIRIRLSSN